MGLGRDVVIVDYLRSPFSKASPKAPEKDALNEYAAVEIMAMLWKEMVRRKKLDPKLIEEATVGTNTPVLEQYVNSGKYPTWWAGLPFEISVHQVEQACGSAMIGLRHMVLNIAAGYCDCAISGGFESMTHVYIGVPAMIPPMRFIENSAKAGVDVGAATSMGMSAQNLQKHANISKEAMDKYSVRSHQLTYKYRDWLKGEIMPIEATNPDGTKFMLDYDLCCRPDTSMESLANLKPAYDPDGNITAGNSSPLTSGATAMLVMSRDLANKLGYKPLAKIVSFGAEGVNPIMLSSTVAPAKKALKNARLQVKDITNWEIHEAFAVVPLYCMQQLGILEEIVDIHGGALAIGHPLGASGLRYIGTLARTLEGQKGKYGCVTMCEGSGQGLACIIQAE